MHYTLLDAEEEKAFKSIEVLHAQTSENNIMTDYFKTYIRYKFIRFKKNMDIKDYIIKKNQYRIKKAAYLTKIKANLQKPFDINNYCLNIKNQWDHKILESKFSVETNCLKLTNSIQPLIYRTKNSIKTAKNSMNNTFKLYNLSLLMANLGNRYYIKSNS